MVRARLAARRARRQGRRLPAPFDGGAKRPPGVHLHWAMPDALVRGELATGTGSNRLSLPALPDRWVVLRLLTPVGATQVAVRGWVLEADRAVAGRPGRVAGRQRHRDTVRRAARTRPR